MPRVFAFLCFLLVTLLLKMTPKHNAEVLSNVPKCEKAVMCLIEAVENMCVR